MAIYRLEKKSISRGNNHNLVAAVAYRAGAKFTDTNTKNPKATTHDYTKKTDVAHSEIVLPDELAEQLSQVGITLDLEQIANLVERGETTQRGKIKEKAKLASEYVLAGSHELSQADNIQAFHDFAKQQAEEQGVVAMVFVHDPKHGEDMSAGTQAADSSKGGDLRNIHAHVVLLSRQLKLSGDQLELGNKSDSELSDTDRKKKGLEPSRQWLKGVREQWADIQNKSLQRHNLAPVTHKSYQDLGLKFKPTVHLGKHATTLERMGKPTYLGAHNESVNRDNSAHLEFAASGLAGATEQRVNLSKQCVESGKRDIAWAVTANEELDKIIGSSSRNTEWANKRTERVHAIISPSERQVAENEQRLANRTRGRIRSPNPYEQQLRTSANNRKQGATELDEQTIIFHQAAERADNNARRASHNVRYRKPELISIVDEIDRLTNRTTMMFANRRNEPNYTDRQKEVLERWANENELVTGDFREDIRVAKAFFDDANNVHMHKNIVRLIRNPQMEELNHSKTHSDAQQDDLNPLTRDYVDNDIKTSNNANESVSIAPRRYRRP